MVFRLRLGASTASAARWLLSHGMHRASAEGDLHFACTQHKIVVLVLHGVGESYFSATATSAVVLCVLRKQGHAT